MGLGRVARVTTASDPDAEREVDLLQAGLDVTEATFERDVLPLVAVISVATVPPSTARSPKRDRPANAAA